MKPTSAQLLAAARRMYGTSCSLIHCKAGGGLSGEERDIALAGPIDATRDDGSEGTWITARVWIPDEALRDGE